MAAELSLQGRHALVTGGGRGIGAAIARRLLAEGASVTLVGRDVQVLERAADELRPLVVADAVLVTVPADISDADSVAAAFAAAQAQAGPVGILVNTPGRRTARRSARPAWRSGSACSTST